MNVQDGGVATCMKGYNRATVSNRVLCIDVRRPRRIVTKYMRIKDELCAQKTRWNEITLDRTTRIDIQLEHDSTERSTVVRQYYNEKKSSQKENLNQTRKKYIHGTSVLCALPHAKRDSGLWRD